MNQSSVLVLLEDNPHYIERFRCLFDGVNVRGHLLSVRVVQNFKELRSLTDEMTPTIQAGAVGIFDLQVPGSEHESGDGYTANGRSALEHWKNVVGRPAAIWSSFVDGGSEDAFEKGQLPELTLWIVNKL